MHVPSSYNRHASHWEPFPRKIKYSIRGALIMFLEVKSNLFHLKNLNCLNYLAVIEHKRYTTNLQVWKF